MKTFTAWIALSAYGHPVPFLGYAFTRKELKQDYARRFPADSDEHGERAFDRAGYKAVRVRVVAGKSTPSAPADQDTTS